MEVGESTKSDTDQRNGMRYRAKKDRGPYPKRRMRVEGPRTR